MAEFAKENQTGRQVHKSQVMNDNKNCRRIASLLMDDGKAATFVLPESTPYSQVSL